MNLATFKINLFPALFLLLTASPATAQIDRWGYWENGVSEPWWFSAEEFTQADADAAIARWNHIGEQLKNERSDEWSGHYFRGDSTHGTFLRWSKSGFVMVDVDKCQAKVIRLRYGKVESTPVRFVFASEYTNQPNSQHTPEWKRASLVFVPVKWGGAFMLIAEDEMAHFGDFVAGLGKYNYTDYDYFFRSEFLSKGGDADTKGSEEPQVPPAYQRFLKQPITASITSVKSRTVKKEYSYENPDGTGGSYLDPVSLTTVTIDAGSDHGLKRGMFLQVSNREGDSVRLLKVEKLSSTGVIVRNLIDGEEKFFDDDRETLRPHSRIRAGWRLTTSHLH